MNSYHRQNFFKAIMAVAKSNCEIRYYIIIIVPIVNIYYFIFFFFFFFQCNNRIISEKKKRISRLEMQIPRNEQNKFYSSFSL